jgi:hypothetical protein
MTADVELSDAVLDRVVALLLQAEPPLLEGLPVTGEPSTEAAS